MKNSMLEFLVKEYNVLEGEAMKVYRQIEDFSDGYHYRIEYCQFGNKWEECPRNEYIAKKHTSRCVSADIEGFATLYTNNPAILEDDEYHWGDVEIRFEEE